MSFIIEQTIDTPYIQLENGLIKISGRSMPENVLKFYGNVRKWIENYAKNPIDLTIIELDLSYTNSSSIKQINDLLKILNEKYLEGFKMKVLWKYEEGDDSALEVGHDLAYMIDIPFEYIRIETQIKQKSRIKVKNKITGKIGEISQKYWDTIVRNGHEKDFELIERINVEK